MCVMYSYSNMHEEHTLDYRCVCGIITLYQSLCGIFSPQGGQRLHINYIETNWSQSHNQDTSAGRMHAGRKSLPY